MRAIIVHAIQLMLEIKARQDGPTKAADILAAMYVELDKDRKQPDRHGLISKRPQVQDWLDQCSRCIATHKSYAAMYPDSAGKMEPRLLAAIEGALKPTA